MGASHHRRSLFLLTCLFFTPLFTKVTGQRNSSQTPTTSALIAVSTPQASSPPSSSLLPGIPVTASGKAIPCSPKNTKLNPSTHKLISDCAPRTFCLAPPNSPSNATGQGICVPRRCRRDDYPYGYARFGGVTNGVKEIPKVMVKGKIVLVGDDDPLLQSKLPPKCVESSFCPDNGSGCRPKIETGGACELGRDEQCRSPPVDDELPPGSLNRAVCLNLKCLPATQPLNAPCTFENVTYVSDINKGIAGGGEFTSFVFKHNCLSPFLFCDLTTLDREGMNPTCQRTRQVGKRCSFDEQCQSGNCEANFCSIPAGTSVQLNAWHWVATIMFIVFSLAISFTTLVYIQRKRRYAYYQEVQEYYHEQMSLRRSMLALHTAAVDELSEKTQQTP